MEKVDKTAVKKIKNKRTIFLRRVTVSLIQLIAIVVSFLLAIFFLKKMILKNEEKIKVVREQIRAAQSEAGELDAKSALTKKYIELWNAKLSEKQKAMNGIDAIAAQNFIAELAQKHRTMNIKSVFSTPRPLTEFSKVLADVVGSQVEIRFSSLTEYPLYYFIREIYDAEMCFVDLEEFSIKKTRNLDKNVVNNLLNGVLDFTFEVELKMWWYGMLKKNK
ncbi:MAG: hypothetical protein LBB09_00705 [Rickettsiales bacterium]|jgi:hypothetical protein|nr:hypothetical protein [Rickettsiales bacterium]